MEKSVQSTKIINRNTSIELLRIISMIMIMFHHLLIMEILNGILMRLHFHIFGMILFSWVGKLV